MYAISSKKRKQAGAFLKTPFFFQIYVADLNSITLLTYVHRSLSMKDIQTRLSKARSAS